MMAMPGSLTHGRPRSCAARHCHAARYVHGAVQQSTRSARNAGRAPARHETHPRLLAETTGNAPSFANIGALAEDTRRHASGQACDELVAQITAHVAPRASPETQGRGSEVSSPSEKNSSEPPIGRPVARITATVAPRASPEPRGRGSAVSSPSDTKNL